MKDEFKLPLISVVMPLYNKEKDVERAVVSVLRQTFQGFELIIVDDGSTDNGPAIVDSIEDRRVRIIRQDNKGVSAARNRGIKESKTDLIAFLDADDEWKPDFLEIIAGLCEKFSDCSVFATNYIRCDLKNGARSLPVIRGLDYFPTEGKIENYFKTASISDPILWTSATAVRKESLLEVGCFPVGIKYGEDLLTWAKLAFRYDIAYSKHPAALFFAPSDVSNRPGRHDDRSDFIGNELIKIQEQSVGKQTEYIKKYISLWERMRAVIYLRHGDRKGARKALVKAIRINGIDFRLMIYFFVAILPGYLSVTLEKMIYKFKQIKKNLESGIK